MNGDLAEPTTSRRGFLRKLGTTIAVGIGFAAVPALAKGSPDFVEYICCPDYGTHCPTCGGGRVNFWCRNSLCGGYCKGCVVSGGGCYDDVVPGCIQAPSQSPAKGDNKEAHRHIANVGI